MDDHRSEEDTGFGGRIDLLAIAPDSSLVLIELKRGRSPREVVAQAIDYATWVEALDAQAVVRIYSRFKKGGDLAKEFEARFGVELDTDVFPSQHQIVIVAASLDASSERIVSYLSKRSVAINVLCFQVFEHGAEKLLSRIWLHDPVESASGEQLDKPKVTRALEWGILRVLWRKGPVLGGGGQIWLHQCRGRHLVHQHPKAAEAG